MRGTEEGSKKIICRQKKKEVEMWEYDELEKVVDRVNSRKLSEHLHVGIIVEIL